MRPKQIGGQPPGAIYMYGMGGWQRAHLLHAGISQKLFECFPYMYVTLYIYIYIGC